MHLDTPATNEAISALYARDVAADGYVANVTRLWAWRPDMLDAFVDILQRLTDRSALSLRERAVLVCTTAASLGDSYCALAWGATLAKVADAGSAAALLHGETAPALSARQAALAEWARRVVRDPNATTPEDVERLRAAGLGDQEIFDATVYVALRQAFSTVNDALGALPDAQLAEAAPAPVRAAVTYGRPVAPRAAL